MRRVVLVLVLTSSLGLPRATPAQTTAEGVAAFERGDYQLAEKILKPLAERWHEHASEPDAVASFHMATLYDGKHGLPADPVRACAHLENALASAVGRFSETVDLLLYEHRKTMGEAEKRLCGALTEVGFDSGLEPVRFEIEPAHWVEIDITGATITFQGKEHHDEMGWGPYGTRLLPIRHTELMVGRTKPMRRHFIEVFSWFPMKNVWHLNWEVYEVVGPAIRPVAGEELLTVSILPSSDEPFDPRLLARLVVNEQRNAEYVARRDDGNEVRGVIRTEAEERERKERDARRHEAEKRVDWNRTYDETRPPSFVYSDQDGCGNAILYSWSESRAELFSITADGEALQLSTIPRIIDIAKHPLDLQLQVQVFARGQIHFSLCTDVRYGRATGEPEPRTWKAISGTATIQLSEAGDSVTSFKYSVMIADAVFVNEFGARIRLTRPLILRAGLSSNLFG